MMRLWVIYVLLVLDISGFSYVGSGRRYVPVLLTFLHNTEEQLLVLLTFFLI